MPLLIQLNNPYLIDLPLLVVERLGYLKKGQNHNTSLTEGQFNKALHILDRLLKNQERKVGDFSTYYPLPNQYLQKIDSNFHPLIKKLKIAGILQVYSADGTGRESYSKENGLCKAYRIAPLLFKEGSTQVIAKAQPKGMGHRMAPEPLNSQVKQDLSRLHFDIKGAKQWVNNYLSYLDLSRWLVNEDSPEYRANVRLERTREGYSQPTPSKRVYRAQQLVDEVAARQDGTAVFKLNDGYVLTTPAEFRTRKTAFLRYYYDKVIQKLENREYWTSQSDTNQRLHHNLTELPKKLLDFLTVGGEALAEVDIANSQVALLAHVLQHGDVLALGIEFPKCPLTIQVQNFLEDARKGVVYDQLANELAGADREVAKMEVIRWLFSGPGYVLPKISPLAQRYGEVVQWVKQVKKVLQQEAVLRDDPKLGLAVYLQRFEAKVMIEQVYPKAKERNLTLFSKHDSFLVPFSQAQEVQELMHEVLANQGIVLNCRYKAAPVALTMAA